MSPEGFKYFVDACGRNWIAGIPHFEHPFIAIFHGLQLDRECRGSVGERIAQEIGGDLLESSQIANHCASDADGGGDLAVRLRVLKLSDHRVQRLLDILDLVQLDADATAEAAAREIEYIIDQGRHAPAVGLYPSRHL